MKPKISVLIPTYNYARFLPEAIESVLKQDYENFELIISDDASSDGSAGILRHYAGKDHRIKLHLHSANLGMVGNWNWCLRQARGEYIKFLFGDDCMGSTQALSKMAAMLDLHPPASMAASARDIIDEDSHVIDTWNYIRGEGLQAGRVVGRSCLLGMHNRIGEPSVVMFRADKASRGFDLRYRQIVDLEMWCHLLRAGDFVYTKEPLCRFRLHAQQQSEVNRVPLLSHKEYSLLFKDHLSYFFPPDSTLTLRERGRVFNAVFYSQKNKAAAPEICLVAHLLKPKLGRGWYAVYWIKRRCLRPFENLWRAWQKYVLGTPYGTSGFWPISRAEKSQAMRTAATRPHDAI